jgi:hypothetical protein
MIMSSAQQMDEPLNFSAAAEECGWRACHVPQAEYEEKRKQYLWAGLESDEHHNLKNWAFAMHTHDAVLVLDLDTLPVSNFDALFLHELPAMMKPSGGDREPLIAMPADPRRRHSPDPSVMLVRPDAREFRSRINASVTPLCLMPSDCLPHGCRCHATAARRALPSEYFAAAAAAAAAGGMKNMSGGGAGPAARIVRLAAHPWNASACAGEACEAWLRA